MLRLLLAVLSVALVAGTDVKGAVNLDSLTFDKLVGGSFDVFLKFDKQYPYGDKEDEWKSFAGRVGELTQPELLIAQVGVQDYGDKLNDDLRERFNVDAENYPVFFLFKKGTKEPIKYTGEVTADALSAFLVGQLGIYIGLPGCVEELDKLAKGFATSSKDEQAQRLSKAEEVVSTLKDDEKSNGQVYINIMKKVQEKGEAYPKAEQSRVEKLVQSKITEEKKKTMRTKLNILPSFV
jgi:endoplasmic reticulum protein 29